MCSSSTSRTTTSTCRQTWLEGYAGPSGGGGRHLPRPLLIDRAANRIFELEQGRVEGYTGNYAAYVAEKRARLERGAQLRELQSGSSAS